MKLRGGDASQKPLVMRRSHRGNHLRPGSHGRFVPTVVTVTLSFGCSPINKVLAVSSTEDDF